MRCPNCDVDLLMAERLGVGIDYCPQCRGIWLERGKLDSILDRGVSQALADAPQRRSADPGDGREAGAERRGEDHGDRRGRPDADVDEDVRVQPRQKKKGSLLGDIMDSFGGG